MGAAYIVSPNSTVVNFTANLAQAAGTYDLCAASGGDVLILDFNFYMVAAGATFTSVQVKTSQTNSVDVMTSTEGAVANLTAQKNVVIARNQTILLKSGQKLQFVLVGATGTGSMLCTFLAMPLNGGEG